MKKLIYYLLLISIPFHIFAKENQVKLFLRAGYNLSFKIIDVLDYGFVTSENQTILFNVIDSAQTSNYELAVNIQAKSKGNQILKYTNFYTIIINKNNLAERFYSPFKPFVYNSINYFSLPIIIECILFPSSRFELP